MKEDQGAQVYMNATMNLMLGQETRVREQRHVPGFVKVLSLPEMARVIAESDRYAAY